MAKGDGAKKEAKKKPTKTLKEKRAAKREKQKQVLRFQRAVIVIYFVYILLCDNGSYYTGYTTNLTRRYQEHLAGTDKCKFTRSFKPVSLAQSWKIQSGKSIALKIEKFIKTLSKEEKKQLILFPERLTEFFPLD